MYLTYQEKAGGREDGREMVTVGGYCWRWPLASGEEGEAPRERRESGESMR